MVFRRIRVGVIVVYRGLVKTGRPYSQIVCPVVTLSAVILPPITFFLSNIKVVAKSELFCKSRLIFNDKTKMAGTYGTYGMGPLLLNWGN